MNFAASTHEQRVRELFDRKANTWNQKFSGYFQNRVRHFMAELRRHVTPGGRVLDFGCGAGAFLLALAEEDYQLAGVDISPRMIDQCRAELELRGVAANLSCGGLDPLLNRNEKFDGIICSSVLEYVPSPRQTLIDLAQLLKPHGTLLVTVPNRQSQRKRLEDRVRLLRPVLRLFTFVPRIHRLLEFFELSQNRYTLDEFAAQLSGTGLIIREWAYFNSVTGTSDRASVHDGELLFFVLAHVRPTDPAAGAIAVSTGSSVGETGGPTSAEPPHMVGRRVFGRLFKFLCCCAATWWILFGVHVALPGIRSGADQVYEQKLAYLRTGNLWTDESRYRVLVFGNSKILAGFIPDEMYRLSDGRVSCFNMGLPASNRFVDDLAQLIERGQTPTHVVLTLPWSNEPPPTLWDHLQDDDAIMERLFPFRRLPRNLVLFAARARTHGGLRAYYGRALALIDQMIADRGYHFIESQSHYVDQRLPADFHLEGDSSRVWPRDCRPEGAVYEKLSRLQSQHGFRVLFVPMYYRTGQFGLPADESPLSKGLAGSPVTILGPDYWRFSNELFSDPDHLNRQGAQHYTRLLWDLLRKEFEQVSAN